LLEQGAATPARRHLQCRKRSATLASRMVVPRTGVRSFQLNDAAAFVRRSVAVNVCAAPFLSVLAEAPIRKKLLHPDLGDGCQAVRHIVKLMAGPLALWHVRIYAGAIEARLRHPDPHP